MLAAVAPLDGAQEASVAVFGKVKIVKKLDTIFYDSACIYYINSFSTNDSNPNYMYIDEDCTIKLTYAQFSKARGRQIILVNKNTQYRVTSASFFDGDHGSAWIVLPPDNVGGSLNVKYYTAEW